MLPTTQKIEVEKEYSPYLLLLNTNNRQFRFPHEPASFPTNIIAQTSKHVAERVHLAMLDLRRRRPARLFRDIILVHFKG